MSSIARGLPTMSTANPPMRQNSKPAVANTSDRFLRVSIIFLAISIVAACDEEFVDKSAAWFVPPSYSDAGREDRPP